MFKTMFSKYMLAFVVIVLVIFLLLTGIISSLIYNYATEKKEKELISTSEAIALPISYSQVEELQLYMTHFKMTIVPFINRDPALDVLIADSNGKILLSTFVDTSEGDSVNREPAILGDLGVIDIETLFSTMENGEGEVMLHHGTLEGITDTNSIACAKEFTTRANVKGYVISIVSTEDQDSLIGKTNETIIFSFVWVMIAAIIAIYFITERIIHPLKNMTTASKKFAKGDFSSRVRVYGNDEVAELGNAFNNMADSLESLEKMRKSFLASISHDLRTPMTTISGFIDGINSGAIPPEKHEYYLGIISAEVHRLSRLVSMLLDISRLESGDRKFNFTSFDVSEVARLVLISFEQKIEDKKLDVEFVAPDGKMLVVADKDAIHQVIYNLCHNAIKFANDSGKFKIQIEPVENKKVKISVFDEGQIISNEEFQMIFKQFYKTDKSRGLDKSGVGLGLYICKTIIDAHGETITVDSRENFGTEFSFTLKQE